MSFSAYDPDAPKRFATYSQNWITSAKKTMGLDLRFDMDSVGKLDGMVESMEKPKNLSGMVIVVGSFLGEAFRNMYGGRWEWDDQFKSWAIRVRIPDGKEVGVWVFTKVGKRFRNGMEDSIADYARVTDAMVKGAIK